MDWGLKNRLSRIIKPQNNRALMLAVDHGYFLGPTEKLENLRFIANGLKVKMVKTNQIAIGIDTPEDLEKANAIFNKN